MRQRGDKKGVGEGKGGEERGGEGRREAKERRENISW
jgi:hypothetical protein